MLILIMDNGVSVTSELKANVCSSVKNHYPLLVLQLNIFLAGTLSQAVAWNNPSWVRSGQVGARTWLPLLPASVWGRCLLLLFLPAMV